MVKLVVCDLDGTLLPRGEKEIDAKLFHMIEMLSARGVAFAVASGRSYHELKRLFQPVEDQIYFIASDGALTVYREQTLFEVPIASRLLSLATTLARKKGLPGILFSGKYLSYYSNTCPNFAAYVEKNLHRHVKRAGSVNEVDGSVYKISFYKKEAIASKELSGLSEIYDGSIWQDFIAKGVGKEKAVAELMKRLLCVSEDVVVFGDNDNDAPMLSLVPNSYAVGEASEAARKASACHTNDVLKTINELILN